MTQLATNWRNSWLLNFCYLNSHRHRKCKNEIEKIVPDFLKPVLRPLYRPLLSSPSIQKFLAKITYNPKGPVELHQYWRQPWDGRNLPDSYLEGEAQSKYLVEVMKRYSKPKSKILEIGCNVGRNLNYLFCAGFMELSGIEISENAVQMLKQSYPEMAICAKIYNSPVEGVIKNFKDEEFDVVFTMTILEHIHTDSEWVFAEIARITQGFFNYH